MAEFSRFDAEKLANGLETLPFSRENEVKLESGAMEGRAEKLGPKEVIEQTLLHLKQGHHSDFTAVDYDSLISRLSAALQGMEGRRADERLNPQDWSFDDRLFQIFAELLHVVREQDDQIRDLMAMLNDVL